MKETIVAFFTHKDLQIMSIIVGSLSTVLSSLMSFYLEVTPLYLFGVNGSLWLIAFIINIIDINTGIKADTKRKKDLGQDWRFESRRGWRAFEKILVFTLIVWFLYTLEKECIRLEIWNFVFQIIQGIKFSMLFYVVLIELQSIGENEEVRFGKKGKMFTLLDKIIAIVNDGILGKLKSFFQTKE